MSKDISIAEGRVSRSFYGVSKLQTNVAEGNDTVTWIPEDEAIDYVDLGEKTITRNGTYKAEDDNKDGYSKVKVNVEGGDEPTLITKTITSNGTYNAADEQADGYSSVTVNVEGGGGGGDLGGTPISGTATANIPAWSTVHIQANLTNLQWINVPLPTGRSMDTMMLCDGQKFIFYKQNTNDGDLYSVPMNDTTAVPELYSDYSRTGPNSAHAMYWDYFRYCTSDNVFHTRFMRSGITMDNARSKGATDKYIYVLGPGNKLLLCERKTGASSEIGQGSDLWGDEYKPKDTNGTLVLLGYGNHLIYYTSQPTEYRYSTDIGAWLAQEMIVGGNIYGYDSSGVLRKVPVGGTALTTIGTTSTGNVPRGTGQGVSNSWGTAFSLEGSVVFNGETYTLANSSGAAFYAESSSYAFLFFPYGNVLYRAEISGGAIIKPSSSVQDGKYLGYVKEAIAQGQTGTAYALFS